SRLHEALRRLGEDGGRAPLQVPLVELPRFASPTYLPRDAFYCPGELLPVFTASEHINRSLLERVCADLVVPYPPGIPMLVPGQPIEDHVLEHLATLLRKSVSPEVHGLAVRDGHPYVRVLSTADEAQLKAL